MLNSDCFKVGRPVYIHYCSNGFSFLVKCRDSSIIETCKIELNAKCISSWCYVTFSVLCWSYICTVCIAHQSWNIQIMIFSRSTTKDESINPSIQNVNELWKKEKLTKIGQVLTGHDVIQLSQSYVLASKVNPFLHQMFPLILTITTPCATDAHNTRYPTNTFLDALASLRSITLQIT